MALLFKAHGDVALTENITPSNRPELFDNKGSFTLEALQGLVGGYVQIVYMNPPTEIEGVTYNRFAMDEEGKLVNKPVNTVASVLAHTTRAIRSSDCLVGDIVLLSLGEFD